MKRPFLMFTSLFTATTGLLLIVLGLMYFDTLKVSHLEQAQATVLPKAYLAEKAEEKGLNYDLLYEIVDCESGWRMVPNAESSAYGFFQILDGTEKATPQYKQGRRKFDPVANIDMGIHLYEVRGTEPWNASRKCWIWAK